MPFLHLLFICLGAYSLVYHFGVQHAFDSSNITSRIALTISIERAGTLEIDPFASVTGDKAKASGHYYSDKAPGMSLFALPAVALVDRLLTLLGMDERLTTDAMLPTGPDVEPSVRYTILTRIATWTTSSLISAVAAVAYCAALLRLGVAGPSALAFALAFCLGTPQWGWSTVFFGHSVAGGLLVLALWSILRLTAPDDDRARLIFAWIAGAFLGLAFLTEFTTAPAAALLGFFALWRLRSRGVRVLAFASGLSLLGAAPSLAILATYNYAAFGGSVHIGYESVIGFAGMKDGAFGLGLPRLQILFEILFGGRRGLFWLCPVLILLPWAVPAAFRRLPDVVVLSVSIFAAYLLVNSGYTYWDGGWSTGPRHVVPSLAFSVLPIALAYETAGRPMRYITVSLVSVGLLVNFVAAGSTMTTPQQVPGIALFTYLWPRFYDFWLDIHPARLIIGVAVLVSIAAHAFRLLEKRSKVLVRITLREPT